MAFLWLLNGGYCVLTNWDDPPSNNYGDRKSPKDRVVGPLPNGLYK